MATGGLAFEIPAAEDTRPEEWNTRESLIFVIDCTKRMFESRCNVGRYFDLCLKCCRAMIMNKIIASSTDLIGIVFYGTREHDPGDHNLNHIVTASNLQLPNADVIKQIDKMMSDKFDFENTYGHSDDYSLSDVLWHVSSLFNKCTTKVYFKTITLMTNEDNPHASDNQKQFQARKKAEDLESLGIRLDVIPFGEQFDGSAFYDELLQIVNGPLSKVESGTEQIEQILDQTYRKDYKKRSVGKLLWNLSPDLAISVDIFNFYRRLYVPSFTKLDRRTNEIIKSVSQTYDGETGEHLLKSDLQKYVEVAEKKIYFNPDEFSQLSLNAEPGLTLLGFKSLDHLTPELHIHPSSFIYPNEEKIEGSTTLFVALLKKCLEKRKYALCCMVARKGGKPSMVALVPQEEITNNNRQAIPPGFHVIYIPFAGNIREIPVPKPVAVQPSQIDIARKVLRKMRFDYKPSSFENAKVQTHWANVEALALNAKKPREIDDLTRLDYEDVSQRVGSAEDNFLNEFFVDDYDPVAALNQKRKYPTYSSVGSRSKIPKMDTEDANYAANMVKAGLAEKLTVPKLQQLLESHNVDVTGMRKKDLVAQATEMFDIKT